MQNFSQRFDLVYKEKTTVESFYFQVGVITVLCVLIVLIAFLHKQRNKEEGLTDKSFDDALQIITHKAHEIGLRLVNSQSNDGEEDEVFVEEKDPKKSKLLLRSYTVREVELDRVVPAVEQRKVSRRHSNILL